LSFDRPFRFKVQAALPGNGAAAWAGNAGPVRT